VRSTLFVGVVIFTVVGVASLGVAASAEGRRRRAWPLAKGTIVRGEVLEIGTHYTGIVRYVYALNAVSAYRGTEHQMEGRLESPPYLTRQEAEDHLLSYPVGDRVDVRYDPTRPTRSELAPR
jgi:hypothetical protein